MNSVYVVCFCSASDRLWESCGRRALRQGLYLDGVRENSSSASIQVFYWLKASVEEGEGLKLQSWKAVVSAGFM